MGPLLRIHTLGSLTISIDDTPVTGFDSRKVQALLVYLACTQHTYPREVLAEMFWEERTQSQALSNLRVALTSLRQTVSPFVTITRETVGIDTASEIWLDAAAFEAQLDGDASNIARLSDAVALYQSDFLAGFYVDSSAFEEWSTRERERLRLRAMNVLDALVTAHRASSDYQTGLARANQLLTLDPLRETTYQHLMQLLALSGEREAALAQYTACRAMLAKEFGVHPTPETIALHERIQAGQLVPESAVPPSLPTQEPVIEPAWQRPRHNLPVQATSFVGREEDIVTITERLWNPDCRLLTLVGPGGMGKTRLALAVAELLVDTFAHGAFFVPLAPLTKPDEILSTMATALQFQFYSGQETAEQQLLNFLHEKEILLVLDNFEHLLDGVGIVDRILSTASKITVLATSRQSLALGWEWLYEVHGMLHPADANTGTLEDYSAVRLFVERARRVQSGFRLADERESVTRICQLVEGMPLGVEIAAAWLRLMPAEAIAAELLDLETLQRDVPERHYSLRALFDHTWQHLTPSEQSAFMQISVFRGGFTHSAAEAVAGATLPRLAALVNKSLLYCDPDTGRYAVHELLRQYAAQQLEASRQYDAARDAHGAYYLHALQAREADLKTDRQSAAIHDITTDLENVRAAWQWAIDGHDIDQIDATLDALWLYCLVCGAVLVGDALFGLAAARLERTPQAHVTLGRVLARQAEFRVSASHSRRELANRSLDLVAGLPQEEAQVAWAMVFNDKDWLAGEAERLRVYLQGGIDYWRVQGDRWKEAMAFFELGEFCYDRYEYAEARRQYEQGLALGRSVGEHFIQGLCLSSIAIVTTDLAENEQYNRDALRHYEALGNRFKVGLVLNNLALVRADIGDLPEAERLISAGA